MKPTCVTVALVSCYAAIAAAQTPSNVESYLNRLMSLIDLSNVSGVDTAIPATVSDVFNPSTGKFMPMSMSIMHNPGGSYYLPVCSVDSLNADGTTSVTSPESCAYGIQMVQVPENVARAHLGIAGDIINAIRSAVNPLVQLGIPNVAAAATTTTGGPDPDPQFQQQFGGGQQQQLGSLVQQQLPLGQQQHIWPYPGWPFQVWPIPPEPLPVVTIYQVPGQPARVTTVPAKAVPAPTVPAATVTVQPVPFQQQSGGGQQQQGWGGQQQQQSGGGQQQQQQ
ncbi:hypothetical protein LPJ53_004000 [Coemansia erecta]|uniref:Uncharacterized protein n=1 Tax=Coemansia erecta TaxID=147472 RepID=A0A9W7XY44_9FUNG|nr:hypothetical protein LPJ53_004000 [Coemansia erecta]